MLSKKQTLCLGFMAEGTFSQKDIAEKVGVTEQTICNWKKNEEFMRELNGMIRISIQSLAAKAFRTHSNLLASKNEMLRYMVAKDILDRAGYKAGETLNVQGALPVIISGDDEIPE